MGKQGKKEILHETATADILNKKAACFASRLSVTSAIGLLHQE
jgi:hypothetical protein